MERKLKWLYSYQKVNFKAKNITSDGQGHFAMIKGSIH